MKIQSFTLMFCGAFLLTPAHAAEFFDATFDDSDWTATKLLDDSPGRTGTFSANQTAAGGNPGPFRETVLDSAMGWIYVGHLNNNFIFNPATDGSIWSIEYSFDFTGLSTSVSLHNGYGPIVFQSGLYYLGNTEFMTTPNEWSSRSHAHHATDFALIRDLTQVDYTAHPDFEATGSPLRFGYFTSSGPLYGGGITHSGIDNLSIAIVPEPSPVLLVAVFALALLGHSKLSQESAQQTGSTKPRDRAVASSRTPFARGR